MTLGFSLHGLLGQLLRETGIRQVEMGKRQERRRVCLAPGGVLESGRKVVTEAFVGRESGAVGEGGAVQFVGVTGHGVNARVAREVEGKGSWQEEKKRYFGFDFFLSTRSSF